MWRERMWKHRRRISLLSWKKLQQQKKKKTSHLRQRNIKYLPRASREVLLQHSQLDDITGVLDDGHDGNGVTAPDEAVQPLGTV